MSEDDLGVQIEKLEHELKKQPANFDLWKRLGQTLRDNSDLEGAIEAFNKALEIKPNNKDIMDRLYECKVELKFLKEP